MPTRHDPLGWLQDARQSLRQPRVLLLVAGMVVAVGLVAVLAYVDEGREEDAALADLAHEQQLLAQSEANDLSGRLRWEGPGASTAELAQQELANSKQPEDTAILLQAPGESGFRTLDGRRLELPWIHFSGEGSASSARLTPAQAAALGLPVRMTVAGLASVDAGPLGSWGLVVVTSAARERDRERRARWRLLLAIVIAASAAMLFGAFALRQERRQAALARALTNAERDEHLHQLGRAVTTMTFASGIAHELSTPLGVISGRAEQLASRASGSGDVRTTQAARTILEQTERMSLVLRGFLDLARGGSPRMELVQARWIVSEAQGLVEHRFTAAGVSLATLVPPGLSALRGNANLLEHALVNILLNACDACARGGLVDVIVENEGDSLAFTVSDDGQGIQPEAATRVLEPFFTTKSPERGTGLGLAIVNEIVKSHHGALTIGPRLPKGTRVRFWIPISSSMRTASDAA